MRSTIIFNRGDVVLVDFVFTDESGAKRRPALVLSASSFHRGREDVIVAAITSNVTRRLVGDYVVEDWQGAGLVSPSTVTSILRTIKRSLIRRRLGSLAAHDLNAVDRLLRRSLGL